MDINDVTDPVLKEIGERQKELLVELEELILEIKNNPAGANLELAMARYMEVQELKNKTLRRGLELIAEFKQNPPFTSSTIH